MNEREMELCWHSCDPVWVGWEIVDWYGPIAQIRIDHHAIDNDHLELFPREARALAAHLIASADEADAAWEIACAAEAAS